MIRISLFIVIMIVAIGIHYYIFYYKPTHNKPLHNNVSETLSNMRTVSSHKPQIDMIPQSSIVPDITQIETNNRPKINVIDNRDNINKKYNNGIVNHNNDTISKLQNIQNIQNIQTVQNTSLCTYTPSNDFVYQNDSPNEPSGSNQIMNNMSSVFLNDNLYQASFFTFSPKKNRIIYVDRPVKTMRI